MPQKINANSPVPAQRLTHPNTTPRLRTGVSYTPHIPHRASDHKLSASFPLTAAAKAERQKFLGLAYALYPNINRTIVKSQRKIVAEWAQSGTPAGKLSQLFAGQEAMIRFVVLLARFENAGKWERRDPLELGARRAVYQRIQRWSEEDRPGRNVEELEIAVLQAWSAGQLELNDLPQNVLAYNGIAYARKLTQEQWRAHQKHTLIEESVEDDSAKLDPDVDASQSTARVEEEILRLVHGSARHVSGINEF